MAEAIESMSQSELRAEVARNRAQKSRSRAMEKAMSMQLVEKGTLVVIATSIGAVEAWKPEIATGLAGLGYLNPAATGLGLVTFLMTRGLVKEFGSGMMLAGAAPLLNKLGAKIVESIGT